MKPDVILTTDKIHYNIVLRKYSLWNRVSLWFYNVCQAARETPPEEHIVYVPINPGDPGYNDAWFERTIIKSPGEGWLRGVKSPVLRGCSTNDRDPVQGRSSDSPAEGS